MKREDVALLQMALLSELLLDETLSDVHEHLLYTCEVQYVVYNREIQTTSVCNNCYSRDAPAAYYFVGRFD